MIIDVSKKNMVKNWGEVKAAVDGVIVRCGYRGYGSGKIVVDPKAAEYCQACKDRGIPLGIYFMSQAITETEAREEADYAVSYARKYGATLPVFIDSEDGDGTPRVVRADGLSKEARTAVAKAFCDQVRYYGLIGGVYASESWYKDKLIYDQLKDYYIWCANYGKNIGEIASTIKLTKWDMHQYTSRGSIPGITGNVDMSCVKEAVPEQVESGNGGKLPVLRKDSKGTAVKVWQAIIGETVDGYFGAKTDTRTRQWQRENGLVLMGLWEMLPGEPESGQFNKEHYNAVDSACMRLYNITKHIQMEGTYL